MEVEQQVADPQGAQLADPEAAVGGEASGEAIPIVSQSGGPPGQEALHHGAMNGEDDSEGAGGALQGAQDSRPRGKFGGPLNGRSRVGRPAQRCQFWMADQMAMMTERGVCRPMRSMVSA